MQTFKIKILVKYLQEQNAVVHYNKPFQKNKL